MTFDIAILKALVFHILARGYGSGSQSGVCGHPGDTLLELEGYCQRVLEQDSEPLVAPGEQVGALNGFLHHRLPVGALHDFPHHRCVNG